MSTKPTAPATRYGTSTSRPCRKAGCGRFTSSEYCSRHTPKVKPEPVAPEQPAPEVATDLTPIDYAERPIEWNDVMPDRWPI